MNGKHSFSPAALAAILCLAAGPAAAGSARVAGDQSAPAPAPSAAPGAQMVSLPQSLNLIDTLLAQATVIVKDAEKAASSAGGKMPTDEASCRRTMTVEEIVERQGTQPLPASFVKETGYTFLATMEMYYRCRFMATNDPKQCEPVKRIKDGVDAPDAREITVKCHDYGLLHKMDGALIKHDPKAVEACVYALTHTAKKEADPARVQAACTALAAYTPDADATCARLIPIVGDKKFAERCPAHIRMLNGAPNCGGWNTPDSPGICEEWVALHKAAAAHSPDACGNHGICRVLMGAGPDACELLASRVKASYCAEAAKHGVLIADAQSKTGGAGQFVFEREKLLTAALDRAEQEIAKADPAAQKAGAAAMKDLDSRQELLSDLGRRWLKVKSRISAQAPARAKKG
jgi:hypothetical protein